LIVGLGHGRERFGGRVLVAGLDGLLEPLGLRLQLRANSFVALARCLALAVSLDLTLDVGHA